MDNANFKPAQLGDIAPPRGWFAVGPSADPLPFNCRQLYNGNNAVVSVTVMTEINPVELSMQIGPYQYLEGKFTHVTGFSGEGNLFGTN